MQKVLRGRGKLPQVKDMADAMAIRHPLIIGRAQAEKLPFPDAPHFTGYHANPAWEDCAAAVNLYRENGCDGLISIGGGSAMDTAKAVKALLTASSPEEALKGVDTSEGPKHIAIPTSAGTGAEATPFAVIYVNHVKHSLSHPTLLPDGIVLDSTLLATLPLYHKKSCALDALCQGIESYWAKAATEDSRVDAYLAILGVLDNLQAYLQGDPHAEDAMLDAAYRSGKAIQVSRTTAAHAMSYGLTQNLGIAHGHACALTLPFLWEQMTHCEEMLPTLASLAEVMRLGSDLMGPKLLCGMLLDLGMTAPAMPEDDVMDRLVATVNVERLSNHPVPLTAADIRTIYRRAFTPLRPNEAQACLDIWRYYGK